MSVVETMLCQSRRFLLRPLICILGSILFSLPATALTSLSVTWNQSTNINVKGYKVYFGSASQQYTSTIDAGNATNVSISGITPGKTYYFSATSYNAAGLESAFSPEISYTVPLLNPPISAPVRNGGGFQFSVAGTASASYVVLASTNLVNWVALATNTAPFVFTDAYASYYGQRFYRVILQTAYNAQISILQPVVQPPLVSPSKTLSGFSFGVNKTVGSAYVVLASTNLINWIPLATNTAPFVFHDPASAQFPQRFYKALLKSLYAP